MTISNLILKIYLRIGSYHFAGLSGPTYLRLSFSMCLVLWTATHSKYNGPETWRRTKESVRPVYLPIKTHLTRITSALQMKLTIYSTCWQWQIWWDLAASFGFPKSNSTYHACDQPATRILFPKFLWRIRWMNIGPQKVKLWRMGRRKEAQFQQ